MLQSDGLNLIYCSLIPGHVVSDQLDWFGAHSPLPKFISPSVLQCIMPQGKQGN